MCNTTATAFVWVIDSKLFVSDQLQPEKGVFAISMTLFVNASENGTLYGCGSVFGSNITSSEKSILFVAGQLIRRYVSVYTYT